MTKTMSVADKPKPFKSQTLEPNIRESLRRVSRWATSSLTKEGPTGKGSGHERYKGP